MKGILFKPDMLKAIVEGRKDVTRRVMKIRPPKEEYRLITIEKDKPPFVNAQHKHVGRMAWHIPYSSFTTQTFLPPYLPGEIVYVKEGWVRHDRSKFIGYLRFQSGHQWTKYRTDGATAYDTGEVIKWKSPLIMPERYARYWLRIKDVRVERLQEIKEEEARREGAKPGYYLPDGSFNTWQDCPEFSYVQMVMVGGNYIDGYRFLWDSIYGPGSWDKNPWVWRIEFELLKEHP
jgi:hypothetical protein